MIDKVLIHDSNEEAYVIGCLINSSSVFFEIRQYLSDDCFYNATYNELWRIIVDMQKNGTPIDIISITSELVKRNSKTTPTDIIAIVSRVATTVNVEYHAMRLKELAQRRKLWKIGTEVLQVGYDESKDVYSAFQCFNDELGQVFQNDNNVFTLDDALQSLRENISNNVSSQGSITGTKTGLKKFDKKGGLQKSDLIIIAGETSQGKTSLALTITQNALFDDAKIAFYSMEMTKEQLAARMVSSMKSIQVNSILYSSTLTPEEISRIDDARYALHDKKLFFDDRSTSNLDSILLSIRALKAQYNIDGAVVDYLQILSVNMKGSSREQIVGESARRLKNIAKELNIWVIALSQLSRDSNNPEPTLNRLRDSGQISEAADVVMLVYRPEYYNRSYPSPYDNMEEYPTEGTAMINVAKGRNIGVFNFFLGFDKSTTHFYETDRIVSEVTQIPVIPIEADAPF